MDGSVHDRGRFLYTAPMKSSARKTWLLMPVLLFSLAGCGKQGDLYLPDERQEAVPETAKKPVLEGGRVRTLPPAPQSQKKDRERQERTSSGSSSEPSQSQPTPVSPPDPDRPATTPPPPRQ